MNIVYRYRNNINLKESEIELQMTECEKFFPEQLNLLSDPDGFFKPCFLLDETTFHSW